MDVERLEKPITEVMTSPVRTVDRDLSIAAAARVLWNERIGSLVVTGERGDPSGIVTESDVVRGVGAGHDPETMTVAELMTASVVTIDATGTVRDASARMHEHDIKKLPVVEDGRLVGMVTTTDLAHSLAPSLGDVIRTFE
jgi:signal-transduction protein with cAMP-binding, CBS, and nucleotidyltransferase domain